MWKVTCVLWISLWGSAVAAQSLQETRELGFQALEQAHYAQAEAYLKRVAFFQQDSPQARVQESLGRCYLALGKPETALAYFDRAFFLYQGKAQAQARTMLGKARSLLQKGAFQEALLELYTAPTPPEASQQRQLQFYLGLTHYLTQEYETAYQEWQPLVQPDSLSQARFYRLLHDEKTLQRPQPKTARILSYLLPGLGQFYAGDFKNGFNSLLLNGTLVTLSVRVAMRYSFLDALLAVIPWFQRYYLGGATKAQAVARKQRSENRRETLEAILGLFTNPPAGPATAP